MEAYVSRRLDLPVPPTFLSYTATAIKRATILAFRQEHVEASLIAEVPANARLGRRISRQSILQELVTYNAKEEEGKLRMKILSRRLNALPSMANTRLVVFMSRTAAEIWDGAEFRLRGQRISLNLVEASQPGKCPPPQLARQYAVRILGTDGLNAVNLVLILEDSTQTKVLDIRHPGLAGQTNPDNDYWTAIFAVWSCPYKDIPFTVYASKHYNGASPILLYYAGIGTKIELCLQAHAEPSRSHKSLAAWTTTKFKTASPRANPPFGAPSRTSASTTKSRDSCQPKTADPHTLLASQPFYGPPSAKTGGLTVPSMADIVPETNSQGEQEPPETTEGSEGFTIEEVIPATQHYEPTYMEWIGSLNGAPVTVPANGQCLFLAFYATDMNIPAKQLKLSTATVTTADVVKQRVIDIVLANLRYDVKLRLVLAKEELRRIYSDDEPPRTTEACAAMLFAHYTKMRAISVATPVPLAFWEDPTVLRAMAVYLREPVYVWDVGDGDLAYVQQYSYRTYMMDNGDSHETGIVAAMSEGRIQDILEACFNHHVRPVMVLLKHREGHFYGVQHGATFHQWHAQSGPDMRAGWMTFMSCSGLT
ncbi:unnamed protein product [Phytophthora fragariaefolia]|uniref:Unnamed protein product n=1 Tax=Phytophthora fragariaefolia TaxID=1490495 RepID=A0A9W6Y9W8_9STRA|nr:unnamed protein product [Phytophthora fragariaefolia]